MASVSANGNGVASKGGNAYSVMYGAEVTLKATANAGYNFGIDSTSLKTWTQNVTSGTEVTLDNSYAPEVGKHTTLTSTFTMNATNKIAFTIEATADTDTNFTIKHRFENVAGNAYEEDSSHADEVKTGTTDTQIDWQKYVKSVNGFTNAHIGEKQDLNIDGDGTQVVTIYYDRVDNLTLTLTNNYEKAISAMTISVGGQAQTGTTVTNVTYGAEITVSVTLNEGYKFENFSFSKHITYDAEKLAKTENTYSYTFSMPYESLTVTANTSRNTNTGFTIVYMFEKLDVTGLTGENRYEELPAYKRATGTGTTDEVITRTHLEGKIIEVNGFTNGASAFGQINDDGEFEPVYINGDGSSTVYIYYDRNTYTVTVNYLYGKGSEYENEAFGEPFTQSNVRYGTKVKVTYPKHDGYEIVNGEGTSAGTGTTITVTCTDENPNANTYTIYYKPIEYTITYETDGGIIGTAGTTEYTVEDAITLPTITKTGYSLDYWCATENAGLLYAGGFSWTANTSVGTTTVGAGKIGDVTLKAHWSAGDNTVTFNTPHLTEPGASLTAESGASYTATLKADTGYLLPTSVTITMTPKDGEGTTLKLNTHYTYADGVITIKEGVIVGDITISASGVADRFKVTINLNDLTQNAGSTNAVVDITTKNDAGATSNKLQVADGVITVYAVYDGTYEKLYTTENGNEYVSLADFTSGLTRVGYKFVIFYYDAFSADQVSGSVTPVTAQTTFQTANDDTEIFAYYTANVITITLSAKDGENNVTISGATNNKIYVKFDTSTLYSVNTDGVLSNVAKVSATRPGYIFNGFVNGEDEEVINTSSELASNWTIDADTTLYADFTADTFEIIYSAGNEDGVTLPSSPVSYNIESDLTLALPTRNGYIFQGWRPTENVGLIGKEYSWKTSELYMNNTPVKGKYGDVTLVATWEPETYEITYQLREGESFAGTYTEKQEYKIVGNYSLYPTTAITRDGYTLSGFTVASETANGWTKGEVISAGASLNNRWGNVTLTANWTAGENSVSVTISNATTDAPPTVMSGNSLTINITPNAGYSVPASVTVNINGQVITADNGYTYDNGVITISEGVINGDVVISGSAVANTYNVTVNGVKATVKGEEGDYASSATISATTGKAFTVYAKADAGYENVKFTTEASGITISEVAFSDGVYSVTVSGNTRAFTITATASPKTNNVIFNNTNLTLNGNKTVVTDTAYTATITADDGYSVPTSITITMTPEDGEGTTLELDTHYTYADGTLNINANVIKADITITATAVANKYAVKFNLNDVTAGNGTTKVEEIEIDGTSLEITAGVVTLYATYMEDYTTLYTTSDGTVEVAFADFISAIDRAGYKFVGFYNEKMAVGADNTSATPITADTVLNVHTDTTEHFAYWTTKTDTAYKVIHIIEGFGASDEVNAITIEKEYTGTTDATVTAPILTSDDFTGKGLDIGGFNMPSETTVTIKADGTGSVTYRYTRKTFTLTLVASTGTESVSFTATHATGTADTVYYNDTVTLTATPKEGYKAEVTWTPAVSNGTINMPAQNATYTATFEPQTYTLTLNANVGGYFGNEQTSTTTQTVTYDAPYGTALVAPTVKAGYIFKGYYIERISADGSVEGKTPVKATDIVKITKDTEIFAYYELDTFTLTVKYQKKDGEELTSMTHTEEVKFGKSYSVPSRNVTGYTADKDVVEGTMPAQNHTVVVTYTPKTYTVVVHSNYPTVLGLPNKEDRTQTAVYDAKFTFKTIEALGWTIDGYTFLGWARTADGEVEYTTEVNPWKLDGNDGDTYEFYAKWSPRGDVKYTVKSYLMNTEGEYEATASATDSTLSGTANAKISVTYTAEGNPQIGGKPFEYAGFTFDGEKTGALTGLTIKNDGSTVIKLYFSRNKVNVTINAEVGATIAGATTGEYYQGKEITISATVSSGYVWNGWTASGSTPTGFTAGPDGAQEQTITLNLGDVTLTATVTKDTYRLSIDPDGGVYEGEVDGTDEETKLQYVEQPYLSSYTLVDPINKTGYTFTGWEIVEGGKGSVNEVEGEWVFTFADGNATVKANWKANRVLVTINAGDSAGSTKATTTVQTNKGTALSFTEGKLEVYAVYDGNYSILYISEESDEYISLADFVDDRTINRVGYTFGGFTLGGSPITSGTEFASADPIEIVAQWTAKEFNLTIEEVGDVTVTVTDKTAEGDAYKVKFDESITLTAVIGTGYHFEGYTSASGYNETDEVYAFNYTTEGDVVITATAKANGYTIKYNGNGGGGNVSATDATYDTATEIATGSGFTRTGYTLTGWTTQVNGTASEVRTDVASIGDITERGLYLIGGKTYAFNLATGAEGDTEVTLYAVWTANQYNVTIDEKEGSAIDDLTDVVYDVATKITGESTRAGYTFIGYSLTDNGGNDVVEVSDITGYENLTAYLVGEHMDPGVYKYNDSYYVFNLATGTGDDKSATIYIVWEAHEVKVRYEYYLETLNGEFKLDSDETFTAEGLTLSVHTKDDEALTGSTINIDTKVVYEGFTYDDGHSGEITSATVTGDGNTVVKIYYTRNTYKVSYVAPLLGVSDVTLIGTVTNDGEDSISGTAFKYNETVTITTTLSSGYTFTKYVYGDEGTDFVSENPYEFKVTDDVTFNIQVTAGGATFKLKYYEEKVDGSGYDLAETSTALSGTVDDTVTIDYLKALNIDVKADGFRQGFEFKEMDETTRISANNDTVIKVYFDRDYFKLTLTLSRGVSALTATVDGDNVLAGNETVENGTTYSVKYGAKITLNYTLEEGYAFGSWSATGTTVTNGTSTELAGTGTLTMPATAVSVSINTTPLPANFIVKYMFETFEDGKYSATDDRHPDGETQVLSDYTGETIDTLDEQDLKSFDGFHYSGSFQGGVVVTADGEATVEVYMDRNDVSINVVLGAGVTKVTLTINETGYSVSQEFTKNGDISDISVKFDAVVSVSAELENGYENVAYTGVTVTTGNFNVPKDAFTLTATADTVSTTITYNGEGGMFGESATYTQTGVKYLAPVTLDSNKFVRNGYTFEGWATEETKDESTLEERVVYANGAQISQYPYYENINLYAVWSNNTYSVTYNGNGGTAGDSTSIDDEREFVYDTAVALKSITELNFEQTGYSFAGWTVGKAGNADEATVVEDITGYSDLTAYLIGTKAEGGLYKFENTYYAFNLATNATDVQLYVVWREHTYTVTYNSNYSSKEADATDVTYPQDGYKYSYSQEFSTLVFGEDTVTFALSGYHFTGWNTMANGAGVSYEAGAEAQFLTSADNGKVTLYAQWEANTYTINYDANKGNGTMSPTEATYDVAVKLTAENFNKTAYDFAGWTVGEAGSADEATVVSAGDLTAYDGNLTKYLVATKKEGGLYKLGNDYYAFNLTEVNEATETVYAVWTAHTYHITYDKAGGTFGNVTGGEYNEAGQYVVPYTIESKLTFITDITMTGHTLVALAIDGNSAWTEALGEEIDIETTTSYEAGTLYGDVTLTAKWEINTHTLTINYLYGDADHDLYNTAIYTKYEEVYDYDEPFSINTPKITGYHVQTQEGVTADTISGTMGDADKTINVYFFADEITVTFDYMDDTVNSPADKFTYESMVVRYDFKYSTAKSGEDEVGLEDATRDGYTFKGWWTTRNYQDGTMVTADTVVKSTSAITLFAKWTANTNTPYTIELKFEMLDSAEFETLAEYASISATGTTDKTPTVGEVEAFIEGRYEAIVGFTLDHIDSTEVRVNKTTVVTAYFTRNYNEITLTHDSGIANFDFEIENTGDVDYVTGSAGVNRVRYGATVILEVTFKDGYEVADTAYEVTGITLGDITSDKFTMIDGDVTIKALSKAKTYTIKYHSNYTADDENVVTDSGTFGVEKQLKTIEDLRFSKAGYGFMGWATTPNGEAVYGNGGKYTMPTYEETVDLYAVWEADAASITVSAVAGLDRTKVLVYIGDAVIGQTADKVINANYDDVVRIEVTEGAILNGYSFNGINIGDDALKSDVDDENSYTITLKGDVTLTFDVTPKTDSQIKVVYATRKLEAETPVEDEPIYDIAKEEIVGGPDSGKIIKTGESVNTELLVRIGVLQSTTAAEDNSIEGFHYISVTNNINSQDPTEPFVVIYNTNIEESEEGTYTTVYILYSRNHNNLVLSGEGDGLESFTAESVGSASNNVAYLQQGEYSVVFGTTVRLTPDVIDGYEIEKLEATAFKMTSENAQSPVATTYTYTDGVYTYYLGTETTGEALFTITEDENGYILSTMPNYGISVKAIMKPVDFTVQYHENYTLDDETPEQVSGVENWKYNVPGNIKTTTDLGFERAGYEFLGWALSANGSVEIREENFKNYNFTYETIAGNDFEIHLYAIWSQGDVNYTVKYYTENLTTGEYDTYKADATRTGKTDDDATATAEDLTPPTGYVLNDEKSVTSIKLGANAEENIISIYFKLIESTLTITALDNANTESVSATSNQFGFTGSYNAEDGVYTASVKYGAEVTPSATPKAGYKLTDWNVVSGNVTISEGKFTMGTEDVKITIDVDYEDYTITFNGEGGTYLGDGGEATSDPYTQDFHYTEVKPLTENKFQRTGYTFAGWATASNGGVAYTDRQEFTYSATTNTNLYAVWTPNSDTSYTISVKIPAVDGTDDIVVEIPTSGTTDAEITEEDAWKALEKALEEEGVDLENVKDGFTFNGFTGFDEGNAPTIGADGKTDVEASFSRIDFSYTFEIAKDAEGVTKLTITYYSITDGEKKTVEVTPDTPKTVTDIAYGVNFTITPTFADGYEFSSMTEYRTVESEEEAVKSWTYEEYPNGVITANSGDESGHTFKVNSKRENYSLIYHANYGEVEDETVTITYLGEVKIESVFKRTGYTLVGWSLTATEQVKAYEANDTIPSYTDTDNLELYAMWQANSYSINYVGYNADNDATLDPTPAVYDTAVELKENVFTRTGYHFDGWTTSRDGAESGIVNVDSLGEYASLTEYLAGTGAEGGIYAYDGKTYAFNLTTASTELEKSVNIYPFWAVNTYTVVLHFDDADTITSITLGTFNYEGEGEEVKIPAFTDERFASWVNEGYKFSGWRSDDVSEEVQRALGALTAEETATFTKLTSENNATIDLYVIWTAGPVQVTAVILYEKLDGTYDTSMTTEGDYELITEVDETTITWTAGADVTPKELYATYLSGKNVTKEGFAFDETRNDKVTVNGNGETQVMLYYKRDVIDLRINIGKGVESVGVKDHTAKETTETYVRYDVRYGETITLEGKVEEGYQYVAYASATDGFTFTGITFEVPTNEAKSLIINATAPPKTDTNYNIEVYLADENDAYTSEATKKLNGKGTTDEIIDVEDAKRIIEESGTDLSIYEEDEISYSQDEEGEDVTTIKGDGTSTIIFKFTRKAFSVTYLSSLDGSITTLPENVSAKFGKTISGKVTIEKGYTLGSITATHKVNEGDGYVDQELDLDIEFAETADGSLIYSYSYEMPAENITVTFNAVADKNTPFIVNYHFENVDLNGYDVEAQEGYTGETGTVITEDMLGIVDGTMQNVREGFEYSNNDLMSNTIIAGDGSTVVNVYFTRIRTKLSLEITDPYSGVEYSTLTVSVNGKLAVGEEADEDAPNITITTYLYEIAYGQTIQVSFELANEHFKTEGFTTDDLVKDEDDELTVGEYRQEGTTIDYIHGKEDVKLSIYIDADEVNYTVRYFTQNVVPIEDAGEEDSNNYSLSAVLIATGTGHVNEVLNSNISTNIIEETYIKNIETVANYDAAKFEGMDLTSFWYKGTYGTGTAFADGIIRVMADDSTTVNIYFNRKIIDINVDLDDNFGNVDGDKQYVYGDTVTITATTEPGYDFKTLTINGTNVEKGAEGLTVADGENNTEVVTYTFELNSTTIVEDAETKANKVDVKMTSVAGKANFTVLVYYENIQTLTYGEPESYTVEGTTGAVLARELFDDYLITEKLGYTTPQWVFVNCDRDEEDNPLIKGDESSVVEIRFNLQDINFEIELGEGVLSFEVSSMYNTLRILQNTESPYTYEAKYGEILQNFVINVDSSRYIYDGISIAYRAEEDDEITWVDEKPLTDFESGYLDKVFSVTETRYFKLIVKTEEIDITIIYDPNNGQPVSVPEGYEYGDEATIKTIEELGFENAGYNFLGWATEAGGEVVYKPGEKVAMTEPLTLYAVWEEIPGIAWWIYLVIGLGILLLIIILIIIIIVVKKKKDREKHKIASK